MSVESKLKAATNDYFHVMFIPKYWSCFAKPDGDKPFVAVVKTNLPGYISPYTSLHREAKRQIYPYLSLSRTNVISDIITYLMFIGPCIVLIDK